MAGVQQDEERAWTCRLEPGVAPSGVGKVASHQQRNSWLTTLPPTSFNGRLLMRHQACCLWRTTRLAAPADSLWPEPGACLPAGDSRGMSEGEPHVPSARPSDIRCCGDQRVLGVLHPWQVGAPGRGMPGCNASESDLQGLVHPLSLPDYRW